MSQSQPTGLSPFLPVIVIPAHVDVIDTEGGKEPFAALAKAELEKIKADFNLFRFFADIFLRKSKY
jgi:hypothetical protein